MCECANGNLNLHFLQSPCISLWLYHQYLERMDLNKNTSASDIVAMWFADRTKWPKEDLGKDKTLVFCFWNDCPKSWKYNGKNITPGLFVDFLNATWKDCFTLGPRETAHIRVSFQSMYVHSCAVKLTLLC